MHRKTMLAVLGLVSAGFSGAAMGAQYFIEAENRAGSLQTVTDYPESNWGLPMSGGYYTVSHEAPDPGYCLYNIPADSIPAGTYYFAERGYEQGQLSRGLGLDIKPVANNDIINGFSTFGTTFNPINQSSNIGWMWAYTDSASSNIATITIASGTGYSIRLNSIGTSPSNFDVFALLSDPVLPSNTVPAGGSYVSTPVPEPVSMGFATLGGAALLRRRRSI